MADRNYVSSDFAAKLERARKRTQRMPQQRRAMPFLPPPPTVSSVFRVLNGGSETIPQYAVMQVELLAEQSGFEGAREAYRVSKPDGEGSLFLINAGGEIESGHFGGGIFPDEPCKVLIDEDADPEFLDTFGPVEDEWHLSSEGSGFAYLGLPDEEEGTAIFRAHIDDSLPVAGGLDGTSTGFSSVTNDKATFLNSGAAVNASWSVSTDNESNRIWVSTTDQTITIRQEGLYQISFSGEIRTQSSTTPSADVQVFFAKDGSVGGQIQSRVTVLPSIVTSTSGIVNLPRTPVSFSAPDYLLEDEELTILINTGGSTVQFGQTMFTVTKTG